MKDIVEGDPLPSIGTATRVVRTAFENRRKTDISRANTIRCIGRLWFERNELNTLTGNNN